MKILIAYVIVGAIVVIVVGKKFQFSKKDWVKTAVVFLLLIARMFIQAFVL